MNREDFGGLMSFRVEFGRIVARLAGMQELLSFEPEIVRNGVYNC